MNFLDICKNVAPRCFVTGRIASVVNQSGDFARVVDAVNEALLEILQMSDSWRFMRAGFEFTTEAGRANYPATLVTGGRPVREYRFNDREVGVRPPGQQSYTPLGVWDFSDYELSFVFGSMPAGIPSVIAVGDDSQLWLGATPDRACSIRGTFTRAAAGMAENTDVPPLPSEYHMLIAHLACMKLAAGDNMSEVYTSAQLSYRSMMRAMRRTQLDQYTLCGPLA
jgi:hypothetical protein